MSSKIWTVARCKARIEILKPYPEAVVDNKLITCTTERHLYGNETIYHTGNVIGMFTTNEEIIVNTLIAQSISACKTR